MTSVLRTLLLVLFVFSYAHSGGIKGVVVGKPALEPLAGVNVILQGTLIGTTTDAQGEFFLARVPVGTYTLTFSLIGHRRENIPDVSVSGDTVLQFRIELSAAPIQSEAVVVTASKREQSLQEIPSSISVMESRLIADRGLTNVEDALRYVPGVNLTETQVSIRGSSGYSRGVGSRVLMLVDGIPLLTGDTGELNFESIPIGQVDRVEVLKGAGSALYGSNALGGVINVLTKPIPADVETQVRLHGGFYSAPSFRSWDWGGGTRFLSGGAFTHSRRFGNTGILLYGSQVGNDGYRQNDYRRRYNGYLKLSHEFSAFDELSLTLNVLHQRRGSFLNWKNLDSALIPPDLQQGDWVRSTRFFLSSQYQHIVVPNLFVTFRGLWFRNRFDDTVDTLTHRSESDMARGEIQATWFVGDRHVLTFGLDGNLESVEASLFGSRNGGGGALYAQDEVVLTDQLNLTIGARCDLQDVDSLESDSQISPKAALLYAPAAGTALRASFGRGFRTPSVAETFITTNISILTLVPNPGLSAERSASYEVGIHQILGDLAQVDFALFQSDFSNLIEPRFVSGSTAQFINVTRARIQGMELNCTLELFERALILDAGCSLINPKDLSGNDVLKYRPRTILYLTGALHKGIFMLGADVRHLSKVERIDEEFKAFVPDADARVPITVVDVRAGLNVTVAGQPVSFVLNVANVLQHNYVEIVGNLAPPRSVVLTVEAEL